jgi:hypothetical protein
MNKILELIATGIDNGSLARFIFVLLAVFMLGFLTVRGTLAAPETQVIVTISTLVLGFYFGNNNKPQVGGSGAAV